MQNGPQSDDPEFLPRWAECQAKISRIAKNREALEYLINVCGKPPPLERRNIISHSKQA